MLNLLLNWRTTLWIGLLGFLVVGSLIPQIGALLLATWWTECQGVGMACWLACACLPVCRCICLRRVRRGRQACTGRRRQAKRAGRQGRQVADLSSPSRT
jgi:hypothetical protein